jgi:hypothetical protein
MRKILSIVAVAGLIYTMYRVYQKETSKKKTIVILDK